LPNVYHFILQTREKTALPDIIELFCKEMPKRICVVTNGTFPLKHYNGLYFYWVSLDGTEEAYDSIRGEGSMKRKDEVKKIE
jgi:MoaA/NifB/PqqE/SkfB family radical SAM enzyme